MVRESGEGRRQESDHVEETLKGTEIHVQCLERYRVQGTLGEIRFRDIGMYNVFLKEPQGSLLSSYVTIATYVQTPPLLFSSVLQFLNERITF